MTPLIELHKYSSALFNNRTPQHVHLQRPRYLLLSATQLTDHYLPTILVRKELLSLSKYLALADSKSDLGIKLLATVRPADWGDFLGIKNERVLFCYTG